MTHQTVSLGKNWKLSPATLKYHRFSLQNRRISRANTIHQCVREARE